MAATRWRLKPFDPARVEALGRAAHIPPLVAHLLLNRGVDTPDAAKRFFQAERRLNILHDPAGIPGVERAAEILVQAVRDGRRVTVYGDYDADGVCGAALLWACLKLAGARDVRYYIPNRFEEGYGLNPEAIRALAAETDVVVSVDCGVTAVAEARLARELGLRLVITDHHAIGPELPDAEALVHPRLPGSQYPFPELCGAGVAFKLAWQVCKGLNDGKRASPRLRQFLTDAVALVAIATVADIMPLRDENRALVSEGLVVLERNPSTGLKALLQVAGLADKKALNSGNIGFNIAPRLNAAGRLESARAAVELLTTEDPARAAELAAALDDANRKRQEIEQAIFAQARELVQAAGNPEERGAIVVGHPDWHPGVVGIVASRVVELHHRPAIVAALRPGIAQASGRSVPGFNLHDAIRACSSHLEGFGGHAAAAGLKIRPERFEEFAQAFDRHCLETLPRELRRREILVDAEIRLDMLTPTVVDWIEAMQPHGPANPRAVFLAHDVEIAAEPRVVGEKRNVVQLQLRHRDGKGPALKGVAFAQPEKYARIPNGTVGSLVFEASRNEWNGRRNTELHVKDFKTPEQAREL